MAEIQFMETVTRCLPKLVQELEELNKTLKAILETYREAQGLQELRTLRGRRDRPPPRGS